MTQNDYFHITRKIDNHPVEHIQIPTVEFKKGLKECGVNFEQLHEELTEIEMNRAKASKEKKRMIDLICRL